MYKILLVDDEPSAMNGIQRAIETKANGFEVAGKAYSADSAFSLVESMKPDVVITDIKMPGKNGLSLIGRIVEAFPDTVILVVSGYDDFSYVRDAFVCGGEDYLLKPVSPEKLQNMLASLKARLDNRGAVFRQPAPGGADPVLTSESSGQKLLASARQFIDGHYGEKITIETVCRHFNVSQPYLSRVFKKYDSITFNDYLNRVRIQNACLLLSQRQDLLLSTVASLCGFTDQFYFSRVFKNETGLTPSEYRRNFPVQQ